MSRIDYITIGIVSVCILAIVFLVYKMTDLFGTSGKSTAIETVRDSVEIEDDEVYDYETDGAIDTSAIAEDSMAADAASSPSVDQEEETQGAAVSASAKPQPPAGKAVEKVIQKEISSPPTESSPPSEGNFMVFAGTFTQKMHAEKRLSKLKELGYEQAGIEIFDRGKFAVVIVDRFNNRAQAESLTEKLQADGIKSYIKVKDE